MAKKFKIVKRPTVRKAKKNQPSFNERVRKVIRGEAETKMKIVNVFDDATITGTGLHNGTTYLGRSQFNVLSVLGIAQGTEQEQREGNKIEDCKLTVRGFVRSRPYKADGNSSVEPFEVHMIAYKLKKDIANEPRNIKSLPGNQTGDVDGTVINSLYPYNKDQYIMRKIRTFKMRPLYAPVAGSNPEINPQSSNAPAYHRFVETIDIHKDLKFNDGSNDPANDWVGISFFVINGDAQTLSATEARASITMDAVLRYKDI